MPRKDHYSARRIALYTESQCDETSSSALAVVRAAASNPLITFSTSARRASTLRSLLSMLASLRKDLGIAALVALAHGASGL